MNHKLIWAIVVIIIMFIIIPVTMTGAIEAIISAIKTIIDTMHAQGVH